MDLDNSQVEITTYKTIKFTKVGKIRTLTEPVILFSNRFKGVYFKCAWMRIDDNRIIIFKGFQWNGCTLARDNEKTNVASCVHDALYIETSLVMARKVKDLVFYDELKKAEFEYANIYYNCVRLFGGLYVKNV